MISDARRRNAYHRSYKPVVIITAGLVSTLLSVNHVFIIIASSIIVLNSVDNVSFKSFPVNLVKIISGVVWALPIEQYELPSTLVMIGAKLVAICLLIRFWMSDHPVEDI